MLVANQARLGMHVQAVDRHVAQSVHAPCRVNKSDAMSSRLVSLLVIRAEETLAIEMNQMIRRVGDPHFGLP